MSVFVAPLILAAIISLSYWVFISAEKRLKAMDSKGQIHFVCADLIEYNPYMPRKDRINMMRDAQTLNVSVSAWDTKCVSI